MRTFKKFIVFIVLFICFLSLCFEGRIVKAFDYTDLGFDSLEELYEALGVSYLLEEKEEPNENISYVINNCEPFIEKYHIEDLNFPISVGFQFRVLPGSFVEMNSEEDRAQHTEYLEELYKTENEEHFNKINLTSYYKTYISKYGPFITFYYESYSNFLETDYQIVENFRDESLACIYIDFSYASNTSSTTTRDNASDYDFDDAKADVGIPENNEYTGDGIKIGIIDEGVTSSLSNLQNTDYEIMPGTTIQSDHCFIVSSILGGDYGIAQDASLYFVSYNQVQDFAYCVDWLTSKNVNIINSSWGYFNNGTYTLSSAYADYVSKSRNVVFVVSSGNEYEGVLKTISPATGINVISVGSMAKSKMIWDQSCYGVANNVRINLNPTLVAPGVKIKNIPNVISQDGFTGTSYAAPFVTGIVALLMEEFPNLKYHPEQVMSLLTTSCAFVNGQTSLYDEIAGFGLVNYSNARNYYNSYHNYTVPSICTLSTCVGQKTFTLDYGCSIIANTCILFNSQDVTLYGMPASLDYTNIIMTIVNNTTNTTVALGSVRSNFSYIEYTNNTNQGLNPTTSFTIYIYTILDKTRTDIEVCSLSYRKMNTNTISIDAEDYLDIETMIGNDYYYLGYSYTDIATIGYYYDSYLVGRINYDFNNYNVLSCTISIENSYFMDDNSCYIYDDLYNYFGEYFVVDNCIEITFSPNEYGYGHIYLVPLEQEDFLETLEFTLDDINLSITYLVWGI